MNVQLTKLAILVPTYKQPSLLAEALQTALRQDVNFDYKIIILNDGCPMLETHSVSTEFKSLFPEKIIYLRHSNKGLSSTRNIGIEFCLTMFPSLDAIFFLDSDNRILPYLLQRLYDGLMSSSEQTGWVYTDVEIFGISGENDLSGPYNVAEHLVENISEAGSMVSRRMLAAGVRFDEDMKLGMEDWDFWLQGVSAGFHGLHVPRAGFQYRRRIESMVKNTRRDRSIIRRYMYTKHAKLFSRRSLADKESTYLPRYALFSSDIDQVLLFTNPAHINHQSTLKEYLETVCWIMHRPHAGLVPPFLVIMDSATRELLKARNLYTSALWNLERAATNHGLATLSAAVHDAGCCKAFWREEPLDRQKPWKAIPDEATAAMIRVDFLVQMAVNLDFSIRPRITEASTFRHLSISLTRTLVDLSDRPISLVSNSIAQVVLELQALWFDNGYYQWWRANFDRHRAGPMLPERLYDEIIEVPSVPPLNLQHTPCAAVVISPSVAKNCAPFLDDLARRQAIDGLDTYTVIYCQNSIEWPSTLETRFKNFLVILDYHSNQEKRTLACNVYFGLPIGLPEPTVYIRGNVSGFTLGSFVLFDRVIFCGCEAYNCLGPLRRLGIETGLAVVPHEQSFVQASAGSINLREMFGALAVEHALNYLYVGDHRIRDDLVMLGVPVGKIYDVTDADWRIP